jgi:predicted Zn-dependent protease
MRAAAIGLALLLSGCGSSAPSDTIRITEEERAFGAEQHPALLAEFGGAYGAEEARYVAAVGERMASAAGLEQQCTFTLVNSDVVNAFAVPGCYIYVTRGLVAIVGSEAELASVLGHELGHIAARHSQRQQRHSLWRRLGVMAVGLTGSDRLTRLAGRAAQFFTLRYSRRQEYEADDYAIRYLQGAEYDVYAAGEMLAALGRQEQFMGATAGRDAARTIPEWALSHPLTQHRIDRARETAAATGLADDALPENADAYLTEVDGLLYGDDPEQGFVTGHRFAHPGMRISFEAPRDFSLTNSPQAIRLQGPDGIVGEFGGGALPPGGLEQYAELLGGQTAGDVPAEVAAAEPVSVNGIAALFVAMRLVVRDAVVPVAIAVYDAGEGQAYHFVVISPPANANAAAVRALFRSFRRLSPEEAARLQPRFVTVVRVAPNDTPATLTRRMADPAPAALFELLNARPADQPLKPGERIKLVTYRQEG